MARETREAPAAVARLLHHEGGTIAALGRRLAAAAPPLVVTCARGSSDHAAHYLKYLLETMLGLPVASMGPSVASVYGTRLRLRGAILVTISQSGRSPDLIAFQAAARTGGALAIALVNDTTGPVAEQADIVVPLHAGAEVSVAATKSFIASAAAAAALAAAWSGDAALTAALGALPARLEAALACDWSAAGTVLGAAPSCYMLGRGPALAIAHEAALKAKEVAGRHAEAFSLAEVMHGPLQLVAPGFPVLAFVPDDAALSANQAALARLEAVGGRVFAARPANGPAGGPGTALAVPSCGHPDLDPLGMAVAYYGMIEAVARARGLDPDRPSHLSKVTKTL
ncbi:MAG: SIS domain-containing protein [Acetobacteraceae bacterium]|nr:SIS domain-containing protein [Acetobacteraceae bacterium]